MGLGDELMAIGHAERAFREGDGRRVAITDRNGKVRWHPLWEGNPIIAPPDAVNGGEDVIRIANGSGCRPYITYPFTAETGWHFSGWKARDHIGRIYFTPEEDAYAETIAAAGPFVLVEPCVKRSATKNKDWGMERYAAVVRCFPGVRFVRPVYEDRRPFHGVQALDGLTFRQVCAVIRKASAYLGAEGGCHHAAGILGVPAVVIFGGALDPEVTGYPGHINFADEEPCGSILPCRHCAAYFADLTVDAVADALKGVLARQGLA